MARRKKRTTRRRFTGINLVNAAEAIVGANIVTQGLFNTDPLAFLIGKDSSGYLRGDLGVSDSGGKHRVGIGELFGLGGKDIQAQWSYVSQNAKDNFASIAVQTVIAGVGFKLGKKLLSKPRREVNKAFKMLGIGQTIRV